MDQENVYIQHHCRQPVHFPTTVDDIRDLLIIEVQENPALCDSYTYCTYMLYTYQFSCKILWCMHAVIGYK